MSITLNTLAYSQDAFVSANKVNYTGPSHTFAVKDLIVLGRTAAKPTSTFAGVARSEMKRTKTVTLADGSKADAYVTCTTAFPVGISEADADALRDDLGDLVISATGKLVAWNHDLTH